MLALPTIPQEEVDIEFSSGLRKIFEHTVQRLASPSLMVSWKVGERRTFGFTRSRL